MDPGYAHWWGTCVGRTNLYPILEPYVYSHSGLKTGAGKKLFQYSSAV